MEPKPIEPEPIYCDNCGAKNKQSANYCSGCGVDLAPGDEPIKPHSGSNEDALKAEPAPKEAETTVVKSKDIGGWLAYFIFGLIVSTGFAAYNAYSYLADTSQYGEYTDKIILLGLCFAALTLLTVSSLWLIFRRKKNAVKVVVFTLIMGVVVYGTDAAVVQTIYDAIGTSAPDDLYSGVGRTLILAPLWILYFLRSKRVANVLVEPGY